MGLGAHTVIWPRTFNVRYIVFSAKLDSEKHF